jgi:WhiB family redox-sensing transcriptional regulator
MKRDWRKDAACIGVDQEVFFPSDRKFTSKTWLGARYYCSICPVREQCLQVALQVDVSEDRWGMFGGMTPSERRWHRRKLASRT